MAVSNLVPPNRTAEPHLGDSAVSFTLGLKQPLVVFQTLLTSQIKSGVIHVSFRINHNQTLARSTGSHTTNFVPNPTMLSA